MEARFTVPNVLTVVRIAMALAAASLVMADRGHALALALLAAGALLDAFDGWYARAFAQATHLGTHLDPFADKVLVTVMYAWIGRDAASVPVWVAIGVVLVREVAVTGFRSWSLRRHGRFIPASAMGRLKMFLQCATGLAILGVSHGLGRPVPESVVLAALVPVALVALVSGLSYARGARREVAGPEAVDGERVAGAR